MCDNCRTRQKVVTRDMSKEAIKLLEMIKEMIDNGCNITLA